MNDSDLQSNYSTAYGATLGFGKRPALILVDFVAAYFNKESVMFADVDAELASAQRIREAAREHAMPVFLTRLSYDEKGINGGVFFRKVKPLAGFVEGNPLGRWAPGLEPHADEFVISKQYASAFFGTVLASTLHTLRVDTLIITGLTTSGCIRATCVDAISHGFIPIVVADACGDRHPDPHKANLFDMNAKYGDVVSEAAVLEYMGQMD
jgi:maleamate amidohydrolase